MRQTIRSLRCWRALSCSTALVVAACGGGDPVPVAAEAERAQAAAFTPIGEAVLIVSPAIARGPQDATVAVGAGVRFSVLATGLQPLTYRWHRNGVPIAGAPGAGTSYDEPAAAAAATYMVRVADRFGNTVTASANLSVVQDTWAQLGGRTLVTHSVSQQPALALCNGPTLAWIDTDSAGIGTLRVWRFAGTTWQAMGSALNKVAGADATEPAIDCLEWKGAQRPAVAWSERTATGRTIVVKTWDGSGWVEAAAGVGTLANADARKPVLRLAPDRNETVAPALLRGRSALAWVENGSTRAKFWNGAAWQLYAGGFPPGTGVSEVVLALDRSVMSGAFFDHPPLMASVSQLVAGQSGVSVQAHVTGWAPLGQSPLLSALPATPKQILGIGFNAEATRPGATVLWIERPPRAPDRLYSPYHVEVRDLLGSDYTQALQTPLAPQPAWADAGSPGSFELHAWSFDPLPQSASCSDGAIRPTYSIALNDLLGTRVLIGACWRSGSDPLSFGSQHRDMPSVVASALSLRVEPGSPIHTPVLAQSAVVNGRHELSVWRSYR